MENQAVCSVCKQRIGIGSVSADVHNMAITTHTMCLPTEKRLGRLENEIQQMLNATDAERQERYGTTGWKLIVQKYIETVRMGKASNLERADYGDAVRGYKPYEPTRNLK